MKFTTFAVRRSIISTILGQAASQVFYLRHIDGLKMKNVTLRLNDSDFRPAIVLDDVKNYALTGKTYPQDKPLEQQVFDADK